MRPGSVCVVGLVLLLSSPSLWPSPSSWPVASATPSPATNSTNGTGSPVVGTTAPFQLVNKHRRPNGKTYTLSHSRRRNRTRTGTVSLSLNVTLTASVSKERSRSFSLTLSQSRSSSSTITLTVSKPMSNEVTSSVSVSLRLSWTRSLGPSISVSASSTQTQPPTSTAIVSRSTTTSATVEVTPTLSDGPPFIILEGSDTINEDSLTQTILTATDGSEMTLSQSADERKIFLRLTNDHWNTLMDTVGRFKLGRGAVGQPSPPPGAPADTSDIVRAYFFSKMTIRAPGTDAASAAVNAAMRTLFTFDSLVISNQSMIVFFNVMPSFRLPDGYFDPVPVEVEFGKALFSRLVAPYTFRQFYIAPSQQRLRRLELTTVEHVDTLAVMSIVAGCAAAAIYPVANGALLMEAPLAAGLQPLASCDGVADPLALGAAPFPRMTFGSEKTADVAGCVVTSLLWIVVSLALYGVACYFIASLKRMPVREAFRYARLPGATVALYCLMPSSVRCAFAVIWMNFLFPAAPRNAMATGLSLGLLMLWLLIVLFGAWTVVGHFGSEKPKRGEDPFALFAREMDDDEFREMDGKSPDPFGESRPQGRGGHSAAGPRSRYQRKGPRRQKEGALRRQAAELWRTFRGLFLENVHVYVDAFELDDEPIVVAPGPRAPIRQRVKEAFDDFLHFAYTERFGSFFTCYRFPWRFSFFALEVPYVVCLSVMEGAAIASPWACQNVIGWLVCIVLITRSVFLFLVGPHNMLVVSWALAVLDAWRAFAVFMGAVGWAASAKGPREASGVMLLTALYVLVIGQVLYLVWLFVPALHRPTEPKHDVSNRSIKKVVVSTLVGGRKAEETLQHTNDGSMHRRGAIAGDATPQRVIPSDDIIARLRASPLDGNALDRNLVAPPSPKAPTLLTEAGAPSPNAALSFLSGAPSWNGLTETNIGGRPPPRPGRIFKAHGAVDSVVASPPAARRRVLVDDPLL